MRAGEGEFQIAPLSLRRLPLVSARATLLCVGLKKLTEPQPKNQSAANTLL
jgi:hypothetical protein